jgi:hypothetical protein
MLSMPKNVASLVTAERVMPLGPGTPNAGIRPALQSLTAETALAPHPVQDRDAALAVLAGLWLYHDHLDESHTISQALSTSEGSFWHAIMHRREPDAWNSKYWWRRVGVHPVLDLLREQTPSLGYRYMNPHDFVDFCDRVRDTGTEDEMLARHVQMLEWRLLLDHCCRLAIS